MMMVLFHLFFVKLIGHLDFQPVFGWQLVLVLFFF